MWLYKPASDENYLELERLSHSAHDQIRRRVRNIAADHARHLRTMTLLCFGAAAAFAGLGFLFSHPVSKALEIGFTILWTFRGLKTAEERDIYIALSKETT
jgi:hypothetical protein